ncbi:hypothetical protein AQUCO_00700749v1 [Aquilegia coerulea]|uniref:Leucine-rich repeat-containing N-terminal plant-type domain-containing protein n=1 Tax=Aquilegia coerulea TaxID=218851 RepID=A0A2G5ELK8_AQUCA|nr:hypothetical protein AQUCO_00700749v1 [Aquilegia coerulea]
MLSSNFFPLLLLLSFAQNLHSLTSPSDITALKAFKSSIKPNTIPSYSCLASWDFSFDPCSLPHRTHFICGLTCNSDSTRVIALVLDPVGYSAPLTPFLSTLTELIHIDFSDNSFYGPIPSSFSSLTKLETLTLRFNSLSGSIPPSLTKLTSLKTLDISHNTLTGSLPNTMSSLTNLRLLDLSFNKLTSGLPKLPSNLFELSLRSNSLTGTLSLYSFKGLNNLAVVELSDNMLTGVLKGWFLLLPSLQQIDLANNSFTRVEIWKPKGSYSNLVSVDLGFNKIDGSLPVDLAVFPSLSSITLRYNKFQGPIPWQYSNKVSLRRIFLDGNYLNGKVPDGFFSKNAEISGSFGNNCLQSCPVSSELCLPSQKPSSICQQVYGKRSNTIDSRT